MIYKVNRLFKLSFIEYGTEISNIVEARIYILFKKDCYKNNEYNSQKDNSIRIENEKVVAKSFTKKITVISSSDDSNEIYNSDEFNNYISE